MLKIQNCLHICLIFIGFQVQDILTESVDHYFHKSEIVPDILKTAPRNPLNVQYQSGSEADQLSPVGYGNQLTPANSAQEPTVSWDVPPAPGELYTLIMIDVDAYPDRLHIGNRTVVFWVPSKEEAEPWSVEHPDAPSRKNPTRRNWLHWLVGNIPDKMVNQGDVIAEYNGPNPPKGSGPHRYVFLLFKQRNNISFEEQFPKSEKGRRGSFNLGKFMAKYQLGDPVAGNFFFAESQVH